MSFPIILILFNKASNNNNKKSHTNKYFILHWNKINDALNITPNTNEILMHQTNTTTHCFKSKYIKNRTKYKQIFNVPNL